MQFHRTTRSEGHRSVLLEPQDSRATGPALEIPVGSCDLDLDSSTTNVDSPLAHLIHKLNARIDDLESQLARLQAERITLEQDISDYRTDLLNTRTELYTEMLNSARHQQRSFDDFRTIQKLEARHQRFCSLLVDIGIPRPSVDLVCQIVQCGNGSADDILVDAIRDASNDHTTLLSRIKPLVASERTPEHYQSALNLTLSVRKELKSQKKRSKFWKKLAQDDGAHANTITPSPSDISSIRQDLTPERQGALNALIARRRTARYTENTEGDVFGGQGRGSALDTLVTSLASRPRLVDDTRFSSSLSSSTTSSSSTSYLSYLSGLSRIYRDSTAETPTVPSRLPSSLSTSLRRSSRNSSQSIVLGSINLNVSRSSIGPPDPILAEGAEGNRAPEVAPAPASTVTRSQDLPQNVGRASLGHGHRRVPSTASRRSARSTSNSFRLSASSFGAVQAISQGHGSNDGSIRALRTPDMRLNDLAPISDTPTSSDSCSTRTSDTLSTPAETQFSPIDAQVESTPLDDHSCKPCPRSSRFLEHISDSDSVSASGSMSTSTSTSDRDHDHDGRPHTIPLGESKDSLFTSSSITSSDTPASTSASTTPATPSTPATPPTPPTTGKASRGRSMLPVLAKHLRRLSLSSGSGSGGSASGSSERLVDRLRGFRRGSRSRSPRGEEPRWRESCGSESEIVSAGESPVKGGGIPVLQRRMTIRARRMSVRKI